MNIKYAIRYFIKLKKHVDWYNDVLPLCIKLKQMVSYDINRNIIIVYTKNFDYLKFASNPLFTDALYYSMYCKCNEDLAKQNVDDLMHMNNRLNEIYYTYYHVELPYDIMDEYNELYPYAMYYNIIKNNQRFDKICELEKEMSEYILANHEIEVINIIKDHFGDYSYESSEIYEL
jgi:hypothetical protein